MFENQRFEFMKSLKVRNYSPNSVSAYGGHLKAFLYFLERRGIKDLRKVNKALLQDFYLSMLQNVKPLAVATLALRVRSVKRFFEYLLEADQIYADPSKAFKEPKMPRLMPKVLLTASEIDKILDTPDLSTSTGVRDRAMLETIYSTAVRLRELLNLQLQDLNLADGLVTIRQGKGRKDRVVPLGVHAVKFLRAYLTHARPALIQGGLSKQQVPYLWLNKRGNPIQPFFFDAVIKGTVLKAGVDKKVTPHVFRHSAATLLLKGGAEVTYVMKLLGHARVKTTQRYCHVSQVEVKQAHEKSHPRNKGHEEEVVVSTIRGIRR
jgi:integrase/recombinase XerD